MTCAAEFPGYRDCEKIDACDVNAYTNIALDPSNPTGIILDTSWDTVKLDLKSIVKAGETITKLELVPEDNPTALRYMREDGTYDCITGDELSRIISMQLLKDVDQTTPPSDGIVYQYNSYSGKFVPFNLKTFVNNTTAALGRLETAVDNLSAELKDIEKLIYNYPADKVTKIPRGDINLYSDYGNTNSKDHGFFTHDPNTDIPNDEYFA